MHFKLKRSIPLALVVVALIAGIVYYMNTGASKPLAPSLQKQPPSQQLPFFPVPPFFDPASLDVTGIQTDFQYAPIPTPVQDPQTLLPAFPPYLQTLPSNLPASITPGFGGYLA